MTITIVVFGFITLSNHVDESQWSLTFDLPISLGGSHIKKSTKSERKFVPRSDNNSSGITTMIMHEHLIICKLPILEKSEARLQLDQRCRVAS